MITTAKPTTQPAEPPKTFTLTGKTYACYRAGTAMGANSAYLVAADNLRKLKHHPGSLAAAAEDIAVQFSAKASELQIEGSEIMSQVAAQDTADEARWRPPLRAWLLLATCMTVSTVVATLVVLALC